MKIIDTLSKEQLSQFDNNERVWLKKLDYDHVRKMIEDYKHIGIYERSCEEWKRNYPDYYNTLYKAGFIK
jgi:hypothetical protein